MLLNFLNSDSASRFLSLKTSNKHFLMAPVHTLSSPELVYIHVSSIYTIGCCSKFRWHGFAQVPSLLIHIQELQQCFCDTIYFYLKIGTNSDLRLLFFHYCPKTPYWPSIPHVWIIWDMRSSFQVIWGHQNMLFSAIEGQ